MCSQDLDLSLLPLVFSLILTGPSRLLHLYSTDDKTSRLMMKSFSTVRDTQRGTQSYMEKRRGRRELEVDQEEKRGNQRGERKLAVITSLCALHSLDPSEMFTELHREEKRRKETEVIRRIEGGIKRRETDPASNQFPKCSPQPRTHKEIH